MANLPVCDEGLLLALQNGTNCNLPGSVLSGWNLRLFQNNHAIDDATVLADLVQCTFPGYSPAFQISFDGFDYMVSPGGIARFDFLPSDFTNTGGTPTTVFGWYLQFQSAGGYWDTLGGGALFSPAVILLPGQTLRVTPHANLASRY